MRARIRKPLTTLTCLLVLASMSGSLGCAFGEIYWNDPLKREFTLSEIQKRYTAFVRFGAFNKASQFVDPELAADFVSKFPTQDDLVFTDHQSERIEFDEDGERMNAIVRVTYSAYYTHSPVVFEVIEVQHWYREGVTNDWKVRPEFTGLEKFAAAH